MPNAEEVVEHLQHPPEPGPRTIGEDLLLAAETAREQAELFITLGRNRDTLQALDALSQTVPTLYVTGEESAGQVRLRAERIVRWTTGDRTVTTRMVAKSIRESAAAYPSSYLRKPTW